ncbi:hypothetical protein PBRA_009374 [Plasmodiophora brassicae]|uniref:TAFII55 protein conserved region domain-containing protein n=1 Tax=Plasmodiophora brassicae TaxID=37360 RepID=A0A0G4J7X1_PLABS|nr:hypothetical protein PBRA_009374 [Plasmodiophora brassicae]
MEDIVTKIGDSTGGSVTDRMRSASLLDQGKPKLEQQIVLRLPERLAAEIRKRMEDQTLTTSSIAVHPIDERRVLFCVDGMGEYPGTLVDLPCIIESLKTWDGAAYYKSADICQMLIVREKDEEAEPPLEFPSGLTPPTAHIRERRFRKAQFSKEEVSAAEGHLWNILQGQPQVHYELIEEEVEVEEEEEEGSESADEWEEEEEEEDIADDEEKWMSASVRSGATGSMLRDTPSATPLSTGIDASAAVFHRATSASADAYSRVCSVIHAACEVSRTGTDIRSSVIASQFSVILAAADTAEPSPLPSPTPPATAAEPSQPEGVPAEEAAVSEDRMRQDQRAAVEAEIRELEAKVEDLTAKAQTPNKILKKRYTKSLEEAVALLQAKRAELAALQ